MLTRRMTIGVRRLQLQLADWPAAKKGKPVTVSATWLDAPAEDDDLVEAEVARERAARRWLQDLGGFQLAEVLP